MHFGLGIRSWLPIAIVLFVSACGSLVAPYDSTFDQSLNKLSEDTAKFLAAASSGGPESQSDSKETTAYYASTYNLLDRLSQRARLTRAMVPCPTTAALAPFVNQPSSSTQLPDDYQKFDCREVQLLAVRLNVDQLHYAHKRPGGLNPSRARAVGGMLQTSIMGAIQTFVVNKPTQ
jgi:hypothetical protein